MSIPTQLNRSKHSTIFVLLFLAFQLCQGQALRVGILYDFEQDDGIQQFSHLMIAEIQKTIGQSRSLELSNSDIYAANWSLDLAGRFLDSLNSRCDIIFLLGSVSIKSALEQPDIPVPTFAIGVFSPEIQGVPISESGTSARKNFTYILNAKDIFVELKEFKRLIDFSHLAFVIDARTSQGLDVTKGRQQLLAIRDSLGTEVSVVSIGEDISASIANIPPEVEAVFLAMPYERDSADISRIAQELINRKLPSFSISKPHVDWGIMACFSDDNGLDQILRKMGVMVDDMIRGEKLADMRVALTQKEALYVNMNTCRAIDFAPDFEILFTANLINDISGGENQRYSLSQIIEAGLSQNLDIQIINKDLQNAGLEVKQARSQYLPDSDLSGTFSQIDQSRTNTFLGQAERSLSAGASLNQVLYSESLIANIHIQQYLQQAQEHATQQQVLDIILDCYTAYLNVLMAKTSIRIQEENLATSRKNLELARIKSSLGSTSQADVYRWEGEVASAQQNTIEAQANLILLKSQLNTLLNNTLPFEFSLMDIGLEDSLFRQFRESPLIDYVKGPQEMRKVSLFLIEESRENFPTKKQLLSNASLLDRQMLMNKRLFYTPTLAVQAKMDNTFWRGGVAAEPDPGFSYTDFTWSAGLNLSYPLFDGNRRNLNMQQTQVNQEQLDLQIRQLDVNLSLQVQSNVLNLLTATTNLEFSRVSKDNMAANFLLVQANYQQGAVSIVQLLDAQQAALQAKQAYALSIYEFILSNLQLEYSIGFFSQLASQEEKSAYEERFNHFILTNQN